MKISPRLFSLIFLILAGILFIPQVSQRVTKKQEWIAVRAITTSDLTGSGDQLSIYHWRTDKLMIGDKEKSTSGKVTAELLGINFYEEGTRKIAVMDISLLSSFDPLTGHFRYKTQSLLTGTNLQLDLGDSHLTAQVIEVNPQMRNKKVIRLDGVIPWQKKWFADMILIGDVYTDRGNNTTPVKVIYKKITYPEEKNINAREIVNPRLFWDIKITLDLEVEEVRGLYYFFSVQPVKVGNTIFVPMDKYNLYNLVITRISAVK